MRLKRSINRSMGARRSSASSISVRIRSIALAPGSDSTSRVTRRSTLVAPAGTLSPVARSTGIDSPVSALSSKLAKPETSLPSAGKRPPAATSIISPGRRVLIATSSRTPSRRRVAVSGLSAINALTPLRARLAAHPSRRSPMRNSSNTIAASAVAPINSAPMAATLISVSIANQLPLFISRSAWRAIGYRPTRVVAIKASWPNGWLNCSSPQLIAIIMISVISGRFSLRRDSGAASRESSLRKV
ncbi:Uncharacterised protein [Salmonella enterica subsp. enterica serovar Typhimurium str. DT104]|nr:Uncharacterised protein [Salmonella enterica subsp. enterica serovar Typhimurium str. DT104]